MKLVLGVFFCLFFLLQNGNCNSSFSKVHSDLVTMLRSGKSVNILINMKEGTDHLLKNMGKSEFSSRAERLNTVTNILKTHAEASQKTVIQFLRQNFINFKSFWISNQIFIPKASSSLIQQLVTFPEISEIFPETIIPLEIPKEIKIIKETSNSPRETQWGVAKILADQVWTLPGGTGQGVVVGNIDSGVRATHEALRGNHRSSYGWKDPMTNQPTPFDDVGHGTHVMGILAGANGIGVAPGSQWIACKGCGFSCSTSHLIECGEFMLCPTLPDGSSPDCSKAPSVVSNSWGGGSGSTWFNRITEAWIAAGIIPFFANGNSGPACSTMGSPADQNVIAVASTSQNDSLAASSSRGPAQGGSVIKPDISGPGQQIYSAYGTGDTDYVVLSGSSTACPHAAGAGALLMAFKQLTYEELKTALFSGADTAELTPPGTNCGGIPDTTYPNNAYGHGRINVYKSAISLLSKQN